jgi:hypothetical protein
MLSGPPRAPVRRPGTRWNEPRTVSSRHGSGLWRELAQARRLRSVKPMTPTPSISTLAGSGTADSTSSCTRPGVKKNAKRRVSAPEVGKSPPTANCPPSELLIAAIPAALKTIDVIVPLLSGLSTIEPKGVPEARSSKIRSLP